MGAATLSTLSALGGQRALASFGTTWLTQHHQGRIQQKTLESAAAGAAVRRIHHAGVGALCRCPHARPGGSFKTGFALRRESHPKAARPLPAPFRSPPIDLIGRLLLRVVAKSAPQEFERLVFAFAGQTSMPSAGRKTSSGRSEKDWRSVRKRACVWSSARGRRRTESPRPEIAPSRSSRQ
jgi:hypothetical protein